MISLQRSSTWQCQIEWEREREREIVKLKEIIFSAREDRKRINEWIKRDIETSNKQR